METNDKLVGQNLAVMRGDMSQEALAKAMRKIGWRWTQTTVYNIEQGARQLRISEAVDVLGVLGFDAAELGLLVRDTDEIDLEQLRRKLSSKSKELIEDWLELERMREKYSSGLERKLRHEGGISLAQEGTYDETSPHNLLRRLFVAYAEQGAVEDITWEHPESLMSSYPKSWSEHVEALRGSSTNGDD